MPSLRWTLAATAAGAFLLTPAVAPADTTFNFLAASEFGRGLGAGVEIGGQNTFVSGVGAGFGAGYSKPKGFIGELDPGVAFGYRRYFGDWFLGPSVGFNVVRMVHTSNLEPTAALGSLLLDLGYRFRWTKPSRSQTRLGLSPGISAPPQGRPSFAGALTISVGVGIW